MSGFEDVLPVLCRRVNASGLVRTCVSVLPNAKSAPRCENLRTATGLSGLVTDRLCGVCVCLYLSVPSPELPSSDVSAEAAAPGSGEARKSHGTSEQEGRNGPQPVAPETPAPGKDGGVEDDKDRIVVEIIQMYTRQQEKLNSTLQKQRQLELVRDAGYQTGVGGREQDRNSVLLLKLMCQHKPLVLIGFRVLLYWHWKQRAHPQGGTACMCPVFSSHLLVLVRT